MTPFVLTGTIIPNAPNTLHIDVATRLNEYRRAISYYLTLGPVYFIENSEYPLLDDPFFISTPALTTLKFPLSTAQTRGKGFQEFEMLDSFVRGHLKEPAFIKVTGRYIYKNMPRLLPWAAKHLESHGIIIDLLRRQKEASVGLFAVTAPFYIDNLSGVYRQMNDAEGHWAEHAVYTCVVHAHAGTFWRPAPALQAVTASMAQNVDQPDRGSHAWLRNAKRTLFWHAGRHELLF